LAASVRKLNFRNKPIITWHAWDFPQILTRSSFRVTRVHWFCGLYMHPLDVDTWRRTGKLHGRFFIFYFQIPQVNK
jgi:hypothetical protein